MRWWSRARSRPVAAASDAPDAAVDAQLEGFTSPDSYCPGDPKCVTAWRRPAQGRRGKHTYTPQNFETYTDENNDRKWESTEPYTDLNGNGKFDGVWLFGGGRAAESASRPTSRRARSRSSRAISRSSSSTSTASACSRATWTTIRNDPMLAGLDIDHIIVGATHAHDAPDTVGLWGPTATSTGREDFVMNGLYDAAAAAIKDAVTSARARADGDRLDQADQRPDQPDVQDGRLEPGHPRSDHLRSDADDRAVREGRPIRPRPSARS